MDVIAELKSLKCDPGPVHSPNECEMPQPCACVVHAEAIVEIERLRRDNANLEHHYRHHREAGERLHTQYHEIREALQEAVDVWASHLNCMPNVHSRKRLDVIRDRFCDEPEEPVAPKTEDEIAF